MRFMMCFFPFIGMAVGLLVVGWAWLCGALGFGVLLPDFPPLFNIWNTVILSLIVTLVLSIPFFTVLVQRMMNIPLRPVARKK